MVTRAKRLRPASRFGRVSCKKSEVKLTPSRQTCIVMIVEKIGNESKLYL